MIREAWREWRRLRWGGRLLVVAGFALAGGTLGWCAWLLAAVGAI